MTILIMYLVLNHNILNFMLNLFSYMQSLVR